MVIFAAIEALDSSTSDPTVSAPVIESVPPTLFVNAPVPRLIGAEIDILPAPPNVKS